jgi:hypothetical protein
MLSPNRERVSTQPGVRVTRIHEGSRPIKLPSPLEALKELARNKLTDLLSSLFNNTDDALFERADRSRSDADQQMYFESMRHLRLHREAVSTTFVKGVDAAFTALAQPPQSEGPTGNEPDFESLTLVNQEELEISVAIAGIVSKVTSLHSLEIMFLTKRIDHVITGMDVTERLNPLGPRVLSEAFVQALNSVDVNITIRILLLKLFERCVMERLGELYSQANRQLAEAGVLPDLRRVAKPAGNRQSPSPAVHTPAPERSGEMAPMAGGFDFTQISQLLGASRVGADRYGSAGVAIPASWISTDQLIGTLDHLQSEYPAYDPDTFVAPQPINLGQMLAARANRLGAPPNAAMRQGDEDVVTFVGMLFDYILNDRNLAIPMKALIARLQIPIVKLAILDKSFFSRPSHPARRLLNELSSAGIGWSSSTERKRDSLYNKIEGVVAGVLEEFQTNPEIFARLLEDLISFVRQEKRRTENVEQRVRETEQGKARTYDAKRRAQNVINAKAAGLRLHPVMSRFISDVWSKVLVYACIKYGHTSEAWTTAVEALDQLLWAIQPLNDLADVEKRDRTRGALITSLRAGMEMINLQADEIAEHAEKVLRHLTEISVHDRGYLEASTQQERVETGLEVIPEVVLAACPEESDAVVPPAADTLLQRIAEGTWFELTTTDGQRIRCKLATILGDGKRFIFVNRKGMKVADRTRAELGKELLASSTTVLDDNQIFDKALQAVIGNLREMRQQTTPAAGTV